jgi:hypothetical protein
MPRAYDKGLALAAILLASAAMTAAGAGDEPGATPESLRAKHAQLHAALEHNHFGRPLHLESQEMQSRMRGDVHAVLAQPFARVHAGLADAAGWCEILTLPFNVKRCEVHGGDALSIYIGRTPQAPVEKAVRIDFRFTLVERRADWIELRLEAPKGPLGTRDYRITLAATPVEGGTFMHMSYGYGYGTLSKLAMQTYLATSGSSKVGFSRDGVDERGEPRLVGGMRGVLERNTMRYFLAIDAHLSAMAAPARERERRRLLEWFDAAERYPRQLHEMSREEYVVLKQQDRAASRQRVAAGS